MAHNSITALPVTEHHQDALLPGGRCCLPCNPPATRVWAAVLEGEAAEARAALCDPTPPSLGLLDSEAYRI